MNNFEFSILLIHLVSSAKMSLIRWIYPIEVSASAHTVQ